MKRVGNKDEKDKSQAKSSALFTCIYGGPTLHFITTGIGADVSLMHEELLGRILQEEGDGVVRYLAATPKLHVAVDTSKDAQPITV